MADEIRFFELDKGAKVPSVGLGTWRVEPGVVADAIAAAINLLSHHLIFIVILVSLFAFPLKSFTLSYIYYYTNLIATNDKIVMQVGYLHIDCAPVYGNEKEVGRALKTLFDDGAVKREDLWITSKLWCTDHLSEDVPKALDRTLQDLRLDYLDLYLIHWPVSMERGSADDKPENLTQPDIGST